MSAATPAASGTRWPVYLRRMVRNTLRALGFLLALLLCLLLVWVGINWRDEDLAPEVTQALQWQVGPNTFSDNGFLVLLGQDAPKSSDAAEAGKQLLQQQLQAYADLRAGRPAAPAPAAAPPRPSGDKLATLRCGDQKPDCVQHYLDNRPAIAAALDASGTQWAHFATMRAASRFEDAGPPLMEAALPRWSYLVQAAEMARMRVLYQVADGHADQALPELLETLRLSRRVVTGSATLIAHMVGVAMVNADLRFVSELVHHYPELARTHGAALLQACAPLTGPTYGMGKAMAFERAAILNTVAGLPASVESWPQRLALRAFFLPHATQNLVYHRFQPTLALADLPADQLAKAAPPPVGDLGYNLFDAIYLRNPVGKVLVQVGQADYKPYMEKHVDADGHARLVALQLKLMMAQAPRDKVADLVANAAPDMRDPYTGSPMAWDAASGKLTFVGKQPASANPGRSNNFTALLP